MSEKLQSNPRLQELAIVLKELREEIQDIKDKLASRQKLFQSLDRERINLQINIWESAGKITKLPTIIPKVRRSTIPTAPLREEELFASLDSMTTEARESLIHSLLESNRKEASINPTT
ncbi:MAG TPA: hypothetical protein VMW50_03480 [Dehalococcoidia bacterium]|nr:hypothetical protein [Dehalococcoidia bacterium]